MTNAILNLLVLAALGVVLGPRLRGLRPGPLVRTGLLMVALTVVFDTVMIAVGLYAFDPDRILGVHVWGAPLEDFAYPIAAVVAMPVLWTALGSRSPSPSRRRAAEPGPGTGS